MGSTTHGEGFADHEVIDMLILSQTEERKRHLPVVCPGL